MTARLTVLALDAHGHAAVQHTDLPTCSYEAVDAIARALVKLPHIVSVTLDAPNEVYRRTEWTAGGVTRSMPTGRTLIGAMA